jgi:cobalt-zinc-cadmium efflux system outer membrane protein
MLPFVAIALLFGLALPAAAQNDVASDVSLADLIQEALTRNPDVIRAQQRVEAMRARVPQAGALPDPMMMTGVVNEGRPVPFETLGTADFSEVYVGIRQDLPFPGKRGLREEVAGRDADAEAWVYESARRRLMASVAADYYDLYAAQAAREIVERNGELLKQIAELARGLLSVGKGTQQDVLDTEVERSHLIERQSLLEAREQTLEAALMRLLGRSEPLHLGRLALLTLTPLPGRLEELFTEADEASPNLREEKERIDAAALRLDLARRDLLPDMGLQLVYHNRGKRSFDPFYAVEWTIALPVYANRKQKKAIEEAAAELGAARSGSAALRAETRYAVTAAYLQASTAERLLHLYDDGLLQQGRLALDSAIAQYDVGKVDFQTVTASWRRLLEDDLLYHEQLAAHEKAVAQIAIHLRPSSLKPF